MIIEKYKSNLMNLSNNFDAQLGNQSDFVKLANEITKDKNERSILEFWKKLSNVPSSKQEEAKGLLLSYLGAEKVEEVLEILRESSTVPLSNLMQ